jgi:hypothetical protein
MKKVLGSISGFVFAAFGLAVLALLMSLTYGALQKLFPGNFANQMWGIVLFDIATMVWAVTFVFQSKSTAQYAIAAIGFITGFLGTLGMVAAEVMLSGQNLAQVDTSQIGQWMVYGFIVVTAIHVFLLYAHHASAPEIAEQISVGVARGEVVSKAIKDATNTIEAEKHELSRAIYYDIVSQVKRDLGVIEVNPSMPFIPITQEIPAHSKEATQAKAPAFDLSSLLWWKKDKPVQTTNQLDVQAVELDDNAVDPTQASPR